MDQMQNNGRRKVRSLGFIPKIVAEKESDRQTTIQKLVAAQGIHVNDLVDPARGPGRVKKSLPSGSRSY
jgi:hypothetical protein